jgi:hypothetical protein
MDGGVWEWALWAVGISGESLIYSGQASTGEDAQREAEDALMTAVLGLALAEAIPGGRAAAIEGLADVLAGFVRAMASG